MENVIKDFKVKLKNLDGKTTTETISAETELEASKLASKPGLFVTDIKMIEHLSEKRTKRIKTKHLIVFSHQMAAMLDAGITTDKALNLVRQKTENAKVKELYGKIYEEVQKGQSVSRAIETTKAFPLLFVNMIKSGEASGDLGKTLKTLSKVYEKEADMKRKIKSALVYPIILAILTVIITIVLVAFVLPGITESFTSENMPWLTQVLMDISTFITKRWYIVFGVIGLTIFGIVQALRVDKIKIEIDRLKTKIPVIGRILRTIYSARAANTISSLYSVGASMLVIVAETGGTIGNRYIERLFDDIYIKVSTGEFLSDSMEKTNMFDPMLTSMIQIGEEAGDLEEVLTSISIYFDNEATAATGQLISLLEPLMLIVMGFIVGIIVIAIMLPLISMGNVVV